LSGEIDKALEAAVYEVVSEMGQPDATASRLIAWLKAMSTEEQDAHEMEQSLDRVLDTLIVKDQAIEN
jgi:hypothetical protein